ncbi:MAG: nicotinamide-nucleotide amidohydrolase family protein [Clostridia bacterium]|nr:nicotinamide-nucleotide amidohydrolase family protein [Clostridia bacterium]
MKNLVNLLKNKNQTISCMESCTGGLLASEITNIDGSSQIFKLGLVTYSNEYKIHFGVSKQAIDTYTVYSINVAEQMAKQVSNLAKSDYGIGITGQLGTKDLTNNSTELNTVYISIYNITNNRYNNYKIEPDGNTKYEKKIFTIQFIKEKLYEICK